MADDRPRATRRLDALRAAAREPPPGGERSPLELDGWDRRGDFLYARRLELPGQAARLSPAVLLRGTAEDGAAAEPGDLLFYDTETTGLSGGAGTLAFLLGTAWCKGPDLEVEQLFLADYPGEPQFLESVRERLAGHRLLVSFNGKTFDSHLLRTRFALNRMPFELGPQLDLLHVSRRLWRSVTGSCDLKTLEQRILGVTRGLDIPGDEIPSAYFEWLRTGRGGLLPAVFEHNVVDVTSLARLYDAVGRLVSGDLATAPVDERALGSWLIDRGSDVGAGVLAGVFDRGDLEAGIRLGLYYKRAGRWEEAIAVWQTMVHDGRSIHAAVELAKFHEHRRHDPLTALQHLEDAFSWNLPLDARTRQELARRRKRLERKSRG